MKSRAIIHSKHNAPLFLDEIDIPEPKDEEVVVKLFASGICGSQLINIKNPKTPLPELLGHEGTGLVVKKGKNVKHVNEGDQVLISWVPYGADAKTEYLKWTHVKWKGRTTKTLIFTWAEHSLMHGQFVSKMPKDFEKYTTSVLGCAGVAGYGTVLNLADIKPGQSAVVFGVGGLGILALNACGKFKANPIVAVDIDDKKLDFARHFGATHLINSSKNDAVAMIKEITNGGADFVFDMVGTPDIIETTISVSKEGVTGYNLGGTVVLTGFPKGPANFNLRSILMGQRIYKGSRGGACIPQRDFPIFYEDYKNGMLQLDQAITKRYKLEQINEAIDALAAGKILGRAIIEIS